MTSASPSTPSTRGARRSRCARAAQPARPVTRTSPAPARAASRERVGADTVTASGTTRSGSSCGGAHHEPASALRPADLGRRHGVGGELLGAAGDPPPMPAAVALPSQLIRPLRPWLQVLPAAGSCRTSTRTSPPAVADLLVEVHADPADVDAPAPARRGRPPASSAGGPAGSRLVLREVLGEVHGLAHVTHPSTQPRRRRPSWSPRPVARAGRRLRSRPASAPCTACATHELSDMPCAAAACSAWFLICSTSRSVIRLMSPVSAPPKPPPNAAERRVRVRRRLRRRLVPADRDADVAAVEAHLDHAVAERGGDLGGQVGRARS